MENGRELLASGTATGRLQREPAAAQVETQSSRLLSDRVDVVVAGGRRRGQPKGAASTRIEEERDQQSLLLHRRGRQAAGAAESTEMLSSSGRIDHADVICFCCCV